MGLTDKEKRKLLKERREQIDKFVGSKSDYHDKISSDEGKNLHISCYKCKAGCIHLEYESLMITCSENEFIQLSDVIIQLRNAMLYEEMQREDEEFVLQDKFAN